MNPQEFIQCRTGKVIRTRQGYWAFIPNALPPAVDWTPRLVAGLSSAAAALGELSATCRLLPISLFCIQPFFRHEARCSLRIDGIMTGPGEPFSTAVSPAQDRGFKSPAGVQHNYEQALRYAVQQAENPPFSLDRLKAVHKRLRVGEDVSESTPGQFRTSQNWVGPPGSTLETAPFVPPPASRLLPLLFQLETFTAAATLFPPLIRTGLVHYQLAALHPFENGNGQTVRIFTSALLNAWGGLPHPLLHISPYLDRNRGSYFDHLMAVSRKSAWEAWLSFFLEGVTAEAHETRDRLHNLNNLREGYRQATAGNRAAARLMAVVDHLFTQPAADINQVAAALGVNYPVAQRYIQQLEAAGIVREITGQARNRIYCAERILETIES